MIGSQIGLQYAFALSSLKLFVKLGYEVRHWFGMHDRTIIDYNKAGSSDRGGSQDTEEADVGFDGPFMEVTAEF